jgi:hypothetical protein
MFKKILIATCLLITTNFVQAQEGHFDLGIEFQAYPTGILPGLKAAIGIGEHSALHLRVGANIFDHRDLGVQEQEEGSGWGFTLGYQYYFGEDHSKFFLGIRNDLWWNSVDWETDGVMGTTDIFVVQPTAIGGYAIPLADGKLIFEPALGLGFEINVKTEGEPTGEGAIGLAGFSLAYRF